MFKIFLLFSPVFCWFPLIQLLFCFFILSSNFCIVDLHSRCPNMTALSGPGDPSQWFWVNLVKRKIPVRWSSCNVDNNEGGLSLLHMVASFRIPGMNNAPHCCFAVDFHLKWSWCLAVGKSFSNTMQELNRVSGGKGWGCCMHAVLCILLAPDRPPVIIHHSWASSVRIAGY